MVMIEVVGFTDPVGPWSWAFEPTRRELRAQLQARWRRVMGVQRDGGAWCEGEPLRTWREVAAVTGAPVNTALEWVHTTTRPAALAVKAAELQGAGEAVLARLREAFFLDGRPPDTPERIAAALDGVAGVPRL